MTKTNRAKIVARATACGADKIRITRNGEIHARGNMPNSAAYGWYLFGFVEHVLDDIEQAEANATVDF